RNGDEMNQKRFLTDLTEVGLCAIIRCQSAGTALPIARTLIAAGVRILEITLTTPDAEATLRALTREAAPGVWVGAGTVISDDDVARATAAGAQFIVTPGLCAAIESAAAAS